MILEFVGFLLNVLIFWCEAEGSDKHPGLGQKKVHMNCVFLSSFTVAKEFLSCTARFGLLQWVLCGVMGFAAKWKTVRKQWYSDTFSSRLLGETGLHQPKSQINQSFLAKTR